MNTYEIYIYVPTYTVSMSFNVLFVWSSVEEKGGIKARVYREKYKL